MFFALAKGNQAINTRKISLWDSQEALMAARNEMDKFRGTLDFEANRIEQSQATRRNPVENGWKERSS